MSISFLPRFRFFAYALLFAAVFSCTAPAYSPSLGLGVDNLTHRDTRLGVSLEQAPNALSAREGGPRLSTSVGFRYERGLSDNSAIRAKFFFAQSVDEETTNHQGSGIGFGLEAILRRSLAQKTDLVFVPRLQYASGGIFGGSGVGGGLSVLVRQRLSTNFAIYGGPAAYLGSSPGQSFSDDSGATFTNANGRALGGHFGVTYDPSPKTNLSLEVSPLNQYDSFYEKSVWLPVAQLTFAYRITGKSQEERETRREIKRMKKAQ